MAPKRRNTTKKNTTKKNTTKKRFSKAVCKKPTLKKNVTRPGPPYKAALCIGKKKKGNDGHMYISKMSLNYGPTRWVKA